MQPAKRYKVQPLIFAMPRISTSLESFLDSLRGEFDSFEIEARSASGRSEYKAKRVRCNSIERKEYDSMSCREKFRIGTYLRVDCLQTALAGRITFYEDVHLSFKAVVDPFSLSDAELREAKTLASHYPSDLDANVYPDQLVQSVKFAKIKDCCWPSHTKLLCCDTEIEQAFPNVSVALRLFLCLMVTNCTGERSFSKLSVIKNKLRTTLSNERLQQLSAESEVMRNVAFESIIQNFADIKTRKRVIA